MATKKTNTKKKISPAKELEKAIGSLTHEEALEALKDRSHKLYENASAATVISLLRAKVRNG